MREKAIPCTIYTAMRDVYDDAMRCDASRGTARQCTKKDTRPKKERRQDKDEGQQRVRKADE